MAFKKEIRQHIYFIDEQKPQCPVKEENGLSCRICQTTEKCLFTKTITVHHLDYIKSSPGAKQKTEASNLSTCWGSERQKGSRQKRGAMIYQPTGWTMIHKCCADWTPP